MRIPDIVSGLLFAVSLYGQNAADGITADEAGRLGLAHFRAGRAAAARPFFEAAVRLKPEDAQSWKLLGLVTTSIGDLDAAASALGKACELAPHDEEACYYLARSRYALGHYEAARAPFEKALVAAPEAMRSKVHRAIALNFVALGLPVEAERHFTQAIQLSGRVPRDSEDPRVDYGAFLFRQGRTEEAVRPLQQAVQDSPSSARANLELGRVLVHRDKLDAAVSHLEKAVQLAPADFNAHLLLGRAYLKLGRTAEGEREMRLGQEGWTRSTAR